MTSSTVYCSRTMTQSRAYCSCVLPVDIQSYIKVCMYIWYSTPYDIVQKVHSYCSSTKARRDTVLYRCMHVPMVKQSLPMLLYGKYRPIVLVLMHWRYKPHSGIHVPMIEQQLCLCNHSIRLQFKDYYTWGYILQVYNTVKSWRNFH